MTQAFNLSQFANRLNTSGQISPSNLLSSVLPINQGGTNNASLAVTAGGVVYTDGTKLVNVGAGNANEYLMSNGSGAPTWSTPASGFSNIDIFTGNGNWTVPAGVTKAKVTVVGGGGSGGVGQSGYGTNCGGGGGGGGGSSIEIVTGLTPGSSVYVTVGGTGGTSSFGAFLSATGGANGTNGSAPGSNATVFRNGGAGGLGANGTINNAGGGGGLGCGGTAGGGGNGGSSIFGGGANGSQGAGVAGRAYGGGGSGTTSTSGAGAGAAGIVIIEYQEWL